MKPATLHIAFNETAAMVLNQALEAGKQTNRVVYCSDDLSLGPINLPDVLSRLQWMSREFRHGGWALLTKKQEEFWKEIIEPDI